MARLAAVPLSRVASQYAYPLIAVALMYHLAHNAGHFLLEAGNVVPVASDPFGSGRDLLGTAGFVPGPLASAGTIWALQIVLVLIGFFWALRTTERAHLRLGRGGSRRGRDLRLRAVTTAFLMPITVFNLWLLAQPMEVRTEM